ncbi:hypothetical protein K435DRAFT_785608 [Dendrothele bispora CBS 962.96]|uniref:Uncharacterized protein n=1 Tax=Dendrothele bispora (strain CBS 962.96) TaxID=1314807 RepID=A0A4S8KSC3_DENBC|nr:hypothetical protein K435DRAFT_786146 [Dendrothele bispora CBS 962.96]THU80062.1 hypothetical protein K435DRAFT_785608 [Dendrothele bispora CBS 962.96]
MHVMHDDDSLSIPSPEPSPRSLSMSTGSRLSRISGSTNEVSEFEAVPGRTGGRKRRDSEHSSISEETSDTRSSFGFVRPVVSATGGAGPSTFTATGHYSTGNGSTTTLTSSSPPPASDPGGSNLSSPYGPGLDFFTARAWKKHPTAGPSLMEVVNSLSTPGGDNHGGMRPVSRGNNNQNPL